MFLFKKLCFGLFDGEKISSLNKSKFLKELKKADLFKNKQLFEKYYDGIQFNSQEELFNFLNTSDEWFNLIFKVK
jgi:hypothetical protein